jgi:hypothetical protein
LSQSRFPPESGVSARAYIHVNKSVIKISKAQIVGDYVDCCNVDKDKGSIDMFPSRKLEMIITTFIVGVIFVLTEIQKVNFLGHEISRSPCGGGVENMLLVYNIYILVREYCINFSGMSHVLLRLYATPTKGVHYC